jgi:hypothetical protein
MKPDRSKRRSDLAPYLIILILCSAILGGALILKPSTSEAPHLQVGRIILPNVCIFLRTTGLPCPGCGLTRSIVAAAHGNMALSFSYHRLGLLILLYVILQFMFNLLYLVIPKWRTPLFRSVRVLHKSIILLAVLFLLNWIITLFLILS